KSSSAIRPPTIRAVTPTAPRVNWHHPRGRRATPGRGVWPRCQYHAFPLGKMEKVELGDGVAREPFVDRHRLILQFHEMRVVESWRWSRLRKAGRPVHRVIPVRCPD